MNQRGAPLQALLVSPDSGLAKGLRAALGSARVEIRETTSEYPVDRRIGDLVRQHDIEAVFLDVSTDRRAAISLINLINGLGRGAAVVAVHTANDPDTILQCLRAGAAEFLANPFPETDVSQAVARIVDRRQSSAPGTTRGQLHVFAPVKGGSGATTLAHNTAFRIRKATKQRVLLADCSLTAGVIGFLLRLKTPYSVVDALRHADQFDEALWKSLIVEHDGVDVLAAPERPEPSSADSQLAQTLFEFMRGMYDHVIVDLGGVCEGIGLTAAAAADHVNVVCSTDMPSLYLMRRTIPVIEELGQRRDEINVLVNRHERRSDLTSEDMEKIFRASVHATFPDDPGAVQKSQREGTTVAENTELGKALKRYVTDIAGKNDEPAAPGIGALRQLLGRA